MEIDMGFKKKDGIITTLTVILSFVVWSVIIVIYEFFKTLHFTFHW